jgi:hypothetical protein
MVSGLLLAAALLAASALGQSPQDQNSAAEAQQHGRDDSRRRDFRGVFGKITEISGSTLKLQQPNGTVATVNLSSSTQVKKERQPIKTSDLKVGDNVAVRGNAAGENVWTADLVNVVPSPEEMEARFKESLGKTIVIGDVKSVDAPKLNIQRVDGVEQTIEADENTSFRKGREGSITLPDIHVGDTVMARGELKNGVFVPSMVNVMDPETARRMKNRAGFGGGVGSGSGANASSPPAGHQPQQLPKQ